MGAQPGTEIAEASFTHAYSLDAASATKLRGTLGGGGASHTTARVRVTRVPGGEAGDVVAVEEPLEIRIGGVPVAVTMRTPGHDEELALGFCLSEGLRPLGARVPDDLAANTVEVEAPGLRPRAAAAAASTPRPRAGSAARARSRRSRSRRRASRASCACPAALVAALPERLREAQAAFEATGGLHATGLFSAEGELLCVREDVGRHNALDKVIGWAFLDGLLPLARLDPLRQRPALVRARAEGRGRGLPAARRGRRAVVARGRARRRPRHHAVRLRPRRLAQRLHGAVADRA